MTDFGKMNMIECRDIILGTSRSLLLEIVQIQPTTALKPLTSEVYNNNHLISMQRFVGKLERVCMAQIPYGNGSRNSTVRQML